MIGCGLSYALTAQDRQESVQIDGAEQYQTMDGFGVNINTAWWYDGTYRNTDVVKPAIDMLVDSLGATIFRAVIEDMDWEAVNDDDDPNHFNWNYYNKVFSNRKFEGIWNTLQYLNRKGISDNLIISLMGAPPAAEPMAPKDKQKSWMGNTDYSIAPEMEDEFVESIAALLYYARHTAKIQFNLVSPLNETDIISRTKSAEHPDGILEGPNIPNAVQLTRIVKKLGEKLDEIGMEDIRFIVPDPGYGDDLFKSSMDEMVKDDYLIGKIAYWGAHNYGDDAANYKAIVDRPENPNKKYLITETAGIENLFGQLDDDAKGYIFWDGFDCVYQHARRNNYENGEIPPNDYVFGFGEAGKPLIEYKAATNSWTPRKQFYQFAQIFKFVKPGATRIAVSGGSDSLVMHAFLNPNKQLVVVGQNSGNQPILLKGENRNLQSVNTMKMYVTDSLRNLNKIDDVVLSNDSFSVSVPPKSVFTLSETPKDTSIHPNPEPSDWYAGDIHVHRDCGGSEDDVLPENKLIEMMKVNDLAVISVLADMGDGEVKPSDVDLMKVNGQDAPLSIPGRTVHYDTEWHWDPFGTTFEHKALGGHLVLLGLREAQQIWDESPYKILEYGRDQGAIVGFAHGQYLNDSIQNDLNCCIPIEYPVEAMLGTIDFLSEDVFGTISSNNGNYNADATINAYYKLLNCGIRVGLAAGTDYPCNADEPLGTLLTYVQVDAPFTYRKWVEGIRDGKTVVARNGHQEFIDLKVDEKYGSGDDIQLKSKATIEVQVEWTSILPLTGSLELVHNGKVLASLDGTAKPGEPVILKADLPVSESGWVCARRMDNTGHQTHTAPVFITLNETPVRASEKDALYFVEWIDNLLAKTAPGKEWNQYFTHDLDIVQGRYKKAKKQYLKIAEDARKVKR